MGANLSASRLYPGQIIVELQAKPKARRAAKGFFEAHCHLWGYPRLAVDKTRQRRTSYAKRLSAIRYIDAQLVEAIPDKVARVIGVLHRHETLRYTVGKFLSTVAGHPRIAIDRYRAFLTLWKGLQSRAVVSEWQLATQFGSGFRAPCVLRMIFPHPPRTPPRGSSTATLLLPPCLRSAASRSRPERIAISAISPGRP